MAAPDETKVFRCGGVLWKDPVDFDPGAPAYGGAKELGITHEVRLSPISRQFNITAEEYGSEVTEAVHLGRDWIMTCLVRGWDDDTLTDAGFYNTATGSSSSNIVISEPGGLLSGSLLSEESVSLLFVPFNTNHKGFILYKALPNLQNSTRLNFSVSKDLSYVVTYRCLRDGSGRMLKIGQVADFGTI